MPKLARGNSSVHFYLQSTGQCNQLDIIQKTDFHVFRLPLGTLVWAWEIKNDL